MTDLDNDSINVGEAEDNIIELTDIVFDAPDSRTSDDIIELNEIVKKQEMTLDLDIIEMEPGREKEDFDSDFEFEDKEEFHPDLELNEKEITFPADQNRNQEFAASFDLTSEQIEAALEKVIEKQFADKIQAILFQVIEKVIEREIVGIRESLEKDLDQIGNV